ncbi:hypothetical protein [Oryzifoliimicrobium ureilyticus]|uniref:hypothetical protein n=1 Tax=Oryzifoliimicrobium ureilyticus TaxID=3113724 RepID=UPI0030762F53
MTLPPEREPGIAPDTHDPKQRAKKASAGRGLAFFFMGALALAFALYLTVVIYGTIKGG